MPPLLEAPENVLWESSFQVQREFGQDPGTPVHPPRRLNGLLDLQAKIDDPSGDGGESLRLALPSHRPEDQIGSATAPSHTVSPPDGAPPRPPMCPPRATVRAISWR